METKKRSMRKRTAKSKITWAVLRRELKEKLKARWELDLQIMEIQSKMAVAEQNPIVCDPPPYAER